MYKTAKENDQEKRDKEKYRNALYDEMEKVRPRKTWSATMPAFCYTELCPMPKYRKRRREDGEV